MYEKRISYNKEEFMNYKISAENKKCLNKFVSKIVLIKKF